MQGGDTEYDNLSISVLLVFTYYLLLRYNNRVREKRAKHVTHIFYRCVSCDVLCSYFCKVV